MGSTIRGKFGGKYGAPRCNQWRTFYYWEFPYRGVARLLFGEFLELQTRWGKARGAGLARGVGVASAPSNAALLPRGREQTCSKTYRNRLM